MGRRQYPFDEAKVLTFLEQGRGTGSGEAYRPWLTIQDVPSRGRSHRPWGILTNREHQLLSDGEWKCFMQFEVDPTVIDIREQFPMRRFDTMRAATALGIDHPTTLDGTPYVLTVDFLITRQLGEARTLEPYTFKFSFEVLGPRDRNLLRIADAYWEQRGLSLRYIDETFFCEPLIRNYDAIRGFYSIAELQVCAEVDTGRIAEELRREIRLLRFASLRELCRHIDAKLDAPADASFTVMRHLLVHREIYTDLRHPVGLENRPLTDFTASSPA